jgi:hypothetical protein
VNLDVPKCSVLKDLYDESSDSNLMNLCRKHNYDPHDLPYLETKNGISISENINVQYNSLTDDMANTDPYTSDYFMQDTRNYIASLKSENVNMHAEYKGLSDDTATTDPYQGWVPRDPSDASDYVKMDNKIDHNFFEYDKPSLKSENINIRTEYNQITDVKVDNEIDRRSGKNNEPPDMKVRGMKKQ